jgi:hypothetical protein
MVSVLPASVNEERDILSKLNSFKPLLVLLNVSGMLPSLSTYSSPWKYQLYNIFSGVTFISYIPLIIMQFIGIYKYSGNLTLLTVIIFQLAAYFDGMVNMAYFIYHRKRLLNMFYLTENKFNPFMQKVGVPEKQIDIIGRNRKFERNITTVAMGAFLADMCTWCVLPSIVRYFAYFREDEGGAQAEEHLEYFILVMWLPENASIFPFYEMLHIFQFLSVWGVVANYAAGKLIIVSLFYHLSAQFRILASAIEDIDVLCSTNLTEDEYNSFSEEITRNIADTNISSASFTGDDIKRSNSILNLFEMETQNPVERDCTSPADSMKTLAGNDTSLSTVQEFRSEVTYLTNCIRYHQNLLK